MDSNSSVSGLVGNIPDTEDERFLVLMRAAYQLLKKQEESSYVLNLLGETTVWDGVECDGYCLMKEMRDILEGKYNVDPDYVEGFYE